MSSTSIICGVHSTSIFVRAPESGAASGTVHDAWTRLCGRRVRAFGRRRDQRLDELVAKADNLVGAHVAADHAVGQARLKRLIDDAAVRLRNTPRSAS